MVVTVTSRVQSNMVHACPRPLGRQLTCGYLSRRRLCLRLCTKFTTNGHRDLNAIAFPSSLHSVLTRFYLMAQTPPHPNLHPFPTLVDLQWTPSSNLMLPIDSETQRTIIRSQIPPLVRYTFMISILNVPQSPPILQSFDAVYHLQIPSLPGPSCPLNARSSPNHLSDPPPIPS